MIRYFKAVRPAAGYAVDEAPTSANITAEVFATVRPTGRILDTAKVVLNGSVTIQASFKMGLLFEDPDLAEWTILIDRHPRDILIRKGLLSASWEDVAGMVKSRNASVLDNHGAEIPASEFLRRIQDEDGDPALAAVRWSTLLADSGKLAVQLQGLPSSAGILNGKPSLKR